MNWVRYTKQLYRSGHDQSSGLECNQNTPAGDKLAIASRGTHELLDELREKLHSLA